MTCNNPITPIFSGDVDTKDYIWSFIPEFQKRIYIKKKPDDFFEYGFLYENNIENFVIIVCNLDIGKSEKVIFDKLNGISKCLRFGL